MKKLFALTLTAVWLFAIAAPPVASATHALADVSAPPSGAYLTTEMGPGSTEPSLPASVPSSALPSAAVEAASATAECAETATITWGGEELTGTLYWSPCVEVSIRIVACSWCECGYIVELPGGGFYTFHDYSEGGSLECGFDSPITFH